MIEIKWLWGAIWFLVCVIIMMRFKGESGGYIPDVFSPMLGLLFCGAWTVLNLLVALALK